LIKRRTVFTQYGIVDTNHLQVLDAAALQANYAIQANPMGYMYPWCTCPSQMNCVPGKVP
jgi:hypothetical protein